jgi:hypothetical protein
MIKSSAEVVRLFVWQLQVQDWLYMDGEDAQANEFKERLDQLKAIGDPILFR